MRPPHWTFRVLPVLCPDCGELIRVPLEGDEFDRDWFVLACLEHALDDSDGHPSFFVGEGAD